MRFVYERFLFAVNILPTQFFEKLFNKFSIYEQKLRY